MAAPGAGDMTPVHVAFAAAARERPDDVAVVDGRREVRYAELDAWSGQAAAHLVERGVGAGSVVGILVERSIEAVVAVLGVLKAGAAFLPLDPAYPDEQLRRMVAHAGLLIAADEGQASRVDGRLAVVTIAQPHAAATPTFAPVVPAADDLAFVAHTSGSTRAPKAVGIRHRSLAVAAAGWLDSYRLRDRPMSHLQYAGFGFDVFVQDLCRCLLSGGRLVICPPAARLDPRSLVEVIAAHGIAFAEFTPTPLLLLVEYLEATGQRLTGLRTLAVGGEPWHVGTYRRLVRVAPAATIVNTYGLAESTIDNLAYTGPPPGDARSDELMPLGRPHLGTGMVVVDTESGLPGAEVGELWLTGDCLSRGYLGQPDLTARRFVTAPGGGRRPALRTGDVVRVDESGVVHYLGRLDDQVKIRGVRVALGEVEAVLRRHPAVSRAAVVPVRSPAGLELAAHVVPHSPPGPSPVQLRELVRQALVPEAVPNRITMCADLPVTANGKVDRARLSGAGAAGSPAAAADRPASPAASTGADLGDLVRQAWQDAVGVPAAETDGDFFAQGGDSVAAARVAMRVALATEVPVHAFAVHEYPTLDAFTRHVRGLLQHTAGSAPPEGPTPRLERDTHPLTPAQRRVWLFSRTHPDSPAYAVPTVIDLTGRLDTAALGTALTDLAARHEPLRTVVVEHGGLAHCRVLAPAPVALPSLDVDGERTAWDLVATLVRQPFDLTAEPPLRAQLLRLAPRRHWLVLVIHHLATDGDSTRILLEQLGSRYEAAVTGASGEPTRPGVTYGDVAVWADRRVSRGEPLAARLDAWRQRLRGYVDRPLALDGAGPGTPEGPGIRHTMRLGPQATAAVRALAREQRTTVFVALLAGFADVIGRWSDSTDVCVGYPVRDRDRAELRDLVGFFVDTCVARVDLSGSPTVASLVRRVHDEVVAATARRVPFELLAEAVSADRGDDRPLFRVWFNHLGRPERPPAMPGLTAAVLDVPEPPVLFDLNLYVIEDDGDIRVDLVHDVNRCAPDTAREILGQYVRLMAAAAADRHARARRLGARAALLPDPADPLVTADSPLLALRLARVARHRPAAVALRGEGTELTYERLGGSVRRAARALAAVGVRRGDLVAVHLRRSPALVTALLAVWAAGGRLLVLDPADPPARLTARLEALRPRCVLLDAAPGPRPPVPGPAATITVDGTVRVRPGDDPASVERGRWLNLDTPGYVAYTSGTTGAPVAVAGTLDPVAHFLRWWTRRFAIGAADRFALLAGLSHDPMLRDVLTPLWAGAALCVPAPEVHGDPAALLAWLRSESVSVAHLTPPLARLLMDAAEVTGSTLPAARLLCLAGDTLTRADVPRLLRLAPAAIVVNGYGTTETPQLVSYQLVDAGGSPALGTGAPGSQLLVLNGDGGLCGVGEPGRIVVRSRHLAEGTVTPAGDRVPFPADDAAGVHRLETGDRGRYLSDGTVAFLGRHAGTVKIHGFRAHPVEVDQALAADSRVAASVTVAVDGPLGTRFATYVVAATRGSVTAPQLRSRLAGLLPRHLIPAVIVFVDRLPLTPNGKIDTSALPPVQAAPAPSGGEPPGSPLERRLSRIWSAVLGIDRVGVTDNFFDLGGTSLSMIRLHGAVAREIDEGIPLLALYQHPSIRALAGHLAQVSGPAAAQRHGTEPEPESSADRAAVRTRRSAASERDRRLTARAAAQGRSDT